MNQAPFSFDLSVMDLYLALASGSTLYSVDKSMITDLKDLFSNFANSEISREDFRTPNKIIEYVVKRDI